MHSPRTTYDIIIVGGGHAGIEAASAVARMGCRAALVTLDLESIGRLSCNPAVGGMAKGQLVCEIDALGGEMARLADKSGIQFKTLGTKKGPAMWSPRSQNDKDLYPKLARQRLEEVDNLTLIAGSVDDIRIEEGRVTGVVISPVEDAGVESNGASGAAKPTETEFIPCGAVVLCAGTFLCGRMYSGEAVTVGGRIDEDSAEHLSGSLREVGFETGRLKTGTPPRLHRDSIDFTACEIDVGDPDPQPFARSTDAVENVIDCYTTWTHDATHDILRKGFDRSPMFTGHITGSGPRYCPSIEDKIFRFSDKPGHMLFLEPESRDTESIYVNGFSTSLPEEIQLEALRTIPGLENCRMMKRGYAVEYDYFPPHQLDASMQSRRVKGLFMAGQINGTSGYEEAAAQGLMAGINAALAVQDRDPFSLDRSEAYIGVLLDDLSTLSTTEPYRMFTSRAEYRLTLRRDNAHYRLAAAGARLGLVRDEIARDIAWEMNRIDEVESLLKKLNAVVAVSDDPDLPEKQARVLSQSVGSRDKAWALLKRPGIQLNHLELEGLDELSDDIRALLSSDTSGLGVTGSSAGARQRNRIREQVEIRSRYEGYIARQENDIADFKKMEARDIPDSIDYSRISSLSSEGREKLDRFRPRSLGHASRISGVSRSDLSVLMLYLR